MITAASDFVQVQLSAAGVAFAGAGGSVRICNSSFDYTFAQGVPVRVLTSEWRKVLSLRSHQGAAILETIAEPEQKAEAEVK